MFGAGKTDGLPVIDLHGQHVNEALRIVERELAQRRAQKAGRARSTQILVGTTHHSKVAIILTPVAVWPVTSFSDPCMACGYAFWWVFCAPDAISVLSGFTCCMTWSLHQVGSCQEQEQ